MFHASVHARPGKNTEPKRCPFCPFVLNGPLLSLFSLKSPFCAVLCPFWPSHKRLKFAGTILFFCRDLELLTWLNACAVIAQFRIVEQNITLDCLQEAKLQPKVRVMIYPAKRSQGLRPSTSETPLSVHEEEKDTIVYHLSKPREVKKSLKSLPREVKKSLKPLPRGVGKAANNIKHYKTTADSVPAWLTLYGDDEGSNTVKRA